MADADRFEPELRRTAIAVIVGALALVFDATIVSVALHTLSTDLRASVDVAQWVSAAYLLAIGVAIPLVGWAQSRLGGKRLWLLSLSLFLIGSVLCSTAWNVQSLIAFRVLQGLGGGVMLPLMTTLVVQAAGGENLGRVMATVTLPSVLGPILGPVLGGVILHYLSWRWLFWVNVPFCLTGLLLAVKLLPGDQPGPRTRLDLIGLLLLSPAVVALLFGLANAGRSGGFDRTDVIAPVILGVLLLSAFTAWAVHRAEFALVDLRLLKHRPLATSVGLLFLSSSVLYGALLLLPLYWQQVHGTDALSAGMLLIPQGVGTFLSRKSAGTLTDRIGTRWVAIAGFLIVAAATIPFALASDTTSKTVLMAALLVRGVGLGAVTIPVMAVAYIGLDRDDVPHASIITRITIQAGGSFGVAVLAAVLYSTIASGHAHTPPQLANAYRHAFWWATIPAAAGAILSLLLPTVVKHPAGHAATRSATTSRSKA